MRSVLFVLVPVSLCAVFLVLRPRSVEQTLDPDYEPSTSWKEKELEGWQPGPENASVPMRTIRHPKMDITGDWRAGSIGHASTGLSISRSLLGTYTVRLDASGCLGGWHLNRTGRYADGVLTLDRPIEDYFMLKYKKLYAVRIGGQEHLLPSAAIEKVQAALSDDGSVLLDRRYEIPRYAFSRWGTKKSSISLRSVRARAHQLWRSVWIGTPQRS
jgi:hypothetical protein